MSKISIVIVCKNEAENIAATLQSLQGITDDILVYDNGSTDTTREIVKRFNANLQEGSWEGFGKTKRKATLLAKYDWILSLDADESIDEELRNSLMNLELSTNAIVYELEFKNFIGKKWLKHGEWGGDKHVRIFNRNVVNWDESYVHEELVVPGGIKVKKMKGYVLHKTMRDLQEYSKKMVNYAMLNAEKYHLLGRKASWFRIHLSPIFTFLNYYLLKLGFLDGHEGYLCARMTAYYTFLKYARLRELNK